MSDATTQTATPPAPDAPAGLGLDVQFQVQHGFTVGAGTVERPALLTAAQLHTIGADAAARRAKHGDIVLAGRPDASRGTVAACVGAWFAANPAPASGPTLAPQALTDTLGDGGSQSNSAGERDTAAGGGDAATVPSSVPATPTDAATSPATEPTADPTTADGKASKATKTK